MSQDIRDFVPDSCDFVAFGEPTHGEPAFQRVRNHLFEQLAGSGFRSIALEIDRVAALAVDDYVKGGDGDLDEVLRDGFSHDFGKLAGNRDLVVWMRSFNERKPPGEQLSLHGFDASTEMMSAPSPRSYLEYARDYLGADDDIAGPAGDDERWSRTEAIMDAAASVGASPGADRLRAIADDMHVELWARAPQLVAATSEGAWRRAEVHLTGGLGLLRYHRESARPGEMNVRISRLSNVRDALMARNLLDIHRAGPLFVHAQNLHLQRGPSRWTLPALDLQWNGAGAILGALGERFTFVAGSLGRSDSLGLADPEPGTYESDLQNRVETWGIVTSATGVKRTDPKPEQGYFPIDEATLEGSDALLHISGRESPAAP